MTLCDPMDCSLLGSSVHGILQARILEWAASPFSRCLPSLGIEPRSFSLTNNWCFWTVVLEKSFESPLDYKEIKPVNPKGNQPRLCIWRTDTEAPILWPPDSKSLLIGKDSDSGKERRQEEKGMTEDEMVGWHHRLMAMTLSKLWEMVKDREAWRAATHGLTKSQTWLSS